MKKKIFYGWWVTIAAFFTFGFAVGLPYYNISFFYDYFERAFGWSKADITLGFPLAALLTIWFGPMVVPRFSPRKLILAGTGLTFLAFLGFGSMNGALWFYYTLWIVYTIAYLMSGPIPHQLMVSFWFRKYRGRAMGIMYVGVGLLGSIGSFICKPLTEAYGFQTALMLLGCLLFLAWPLVLLVLRNRPEEMGLHPDGASEPAADVKLEPRPLKELLSSYGFWLLLIGSVCSIGSIGAINFHMKFVFLDQGFTKGPMVDSAWRTASIMILWSSIAGRLSIGYFSDKFSKKWVMFWSYFITAATIPLMLMVHPGSEMTLYAFAILFGFGMGADYMMIPLIAADQFGVNSLARAMAVILPANTIGQTWFPYFVSILRESYGSYKVAMGTVLAVAAIGAISIALLPKQSKLAISPQMQESGKAQIKS